MFKCTSCGSATRSLYYKRQKRQTHHAPCDAPNGTHKMHTKMCTSKTCGKRFSICDRHVKLGWQEWHQEERFGRRNCKAKMWVHNCKACTQVEKPEASMVLCPECKAPFINKGPKWYLNLAKRCRHGKTRNCAWLKVSQSVKTLINLGESSEEIVERILGLTCVKRDREHSGPMDSPPVCVTPPLPTKLLAKEEPTDRTPKLKPKPTPLGTLWDSKPSTEPVKQTSPPKKRPRKELQEDDIGLDYGHFDEENLLLSSFEKNFGPFCQDDDLNIEDDLVWCHYNANDSFAL